MTDLRRPSHHGRPGRRRTPFLLIELATLLSGTGNGVAAVALPWLVLERTGRPAAAGIVAAASALPMLLSSLVAGTIVDRFGRRRTAVVADLLSAGAVAAIPIVDATLVLTVPVLAALAVLGATLDPAGLTARETILPEAAAVARIPIDRANSIHEAVWGTAFLIGPGIGGLLIGVVGAVPTFWITAVGFAISAGLLLCLRLAQARQATPAPEGLWRGTINGLAFVWRDRLMRTIGLVTMGLVAFYLPVEGVLLPVYFTEQASPQRLGVIVMSMSAGGIVGALLFGWLAHRMRRRTAFVVAFLGTGVALVGLAVLPPYPVMVACAVVTGLAYGPVNPLANYAIQTRTPERLRGRVFGVLTSSAYAAGPAGYVLAGPLVEWIGVGPAFLLLAGGILILALSTPLMRSLTELDAAPRYAPAPSEVVSHGGPPLGEQWVPAARPDDSSLD
jgi:MFS family permease